MVIYVFFLVFVEDYVGILHILEVPINAYELRKEDKILVIYINRIPKYENKSYREILKSLEK